jgi:hypothetical protein
MRKPEIRHEKEMRKEKAKAKKNYLKLAKATNFSSHWIKMLKYLRDFGTQHSKAACGQYWTWLHSKFGSLSFRASLVL